MLYPKRFILCFFSLAIFLPQLSFSAEIYGHRGARGLSPENTIPAYKTAIELGVDYVDMDIGMSRDGVLVVTHDLTLDPVITRDEKGQWITNKLLVKSLTLAQIKTYDVGRINPQSKYASYFPDQYWLNRIEIPTLQEVIRYVKTHAPSTMKFQIEVKTDPTKKDETVTPEVFAKALITLLEKEGIVLRTEVQAFDYRVLLALQKINPDIKTAYLTAKISAENMKNSNPEIAGLWSAGRLLKDYDYSIPKMIHAMGGKIWGPQDIEVTKENVKEAHQLGLKVVPWTWPENTGSEINTQMIEKLLGLGVDGIITDRPDILKGLKAARQN